MYTDTQMVPPLSSGVIHDQRAIETATSVLCQAGQDWFILKVELLK